MRILVNGSAEIHNRIAAEPNPTFTSELGERGSASMTTIFKKGQGIFGPGYSDIAVDERGAIEISDDGAILIDNENSANRMLRRGDVVSAESHGLTYRSACNAVNSLYRYMSFDGLSGNIKPRVFKTGAVPYGFAGRVREVDHAGYWVHGLNLMDEFSIGGWVREEHISDAFLFRFLPAEFSDWIFLRLRRIGAGSDSLMTYETNEIQVFEDGPISSGNGRSDIRLIAKFPGALGLLMVDMVNLSEWTHVFFVRGRSRSAIYINGEIAIERTGDPQSFSSGVDLDIGVGNTAGSDIYNTWLMDEWAIFRSEVDVKELYDSRHNDRVFFGQVWDVNDRPAKAKADEVYTDVKLVGASSILDNTEPVFNYARSSIRLVDLIREVIPSSIGGVDIDVGWVDPSIVVNNVRELVPIFPWQLLNNIADLLNVNVWIDNYGFIHFLNIDGFAIESGRHSVDSSNIKTSSVGNRSSLYASTVYVHRTSDAVVEVVRVDASDDRKDRYGPSTKILQASEAHEDLESIGSRYLNLHHTTVGDFKGTLKEGSIHVMHVGDVLDIDDRKHSLKEMRVLGKLTSKLVPIQPNHLDRFEHSVVASSGHWGNKKREWWQSLQRAR